ncbi:MAG: diaminopimelate decarboxylase [Chlorobi bacterium]|nr:diaminopimelate decarboxylase [Chlorobiota bacterium]
MSEKLKYERPIITKINAGVTDKFGMQSKMPIITEIDKIPVEKLIKDYGSPSFILSEKTIRQTFNNAKRAFTTRYPNVQFAWSYKTNYMNAVCRIFHKEGSWAEVVSGFEYDKALKNGVPGNKIIFNGPDKSKENLIKATENGSYIHIDHFDELYELLSIAETTKKRPKVAIRVNMDTGIYPQWDRFGFNYENGEAWNALNRILMSKKLDLVGLHTHIGTYMMTPTPYSVAASKLAELAVRLDRKFNHKIKYIDMGGGFASKNTLKGAYLPGKDTCPTFDQYAEAISDALINSELDPNEMPTLFLETGRALIDDAGYIIGSVLANKRLANGRRSMIIDTGVNMLFTSFWYEHEIYPAKEFSSHAEDTTIYGPLCMNIDVIRSAVKFPLLQKGDHYVIKRIGAYNMTQWMQFITLRPKIILIDTDNNTHIIRENETNESMTALEKVPNYLN